jgi:predicted nucleic acid-binding protein
VNRLILLDNEAVHALADPVHPKHRKVLSHVQVVAQRKQRAVPIRLEVPTTVRVEAGWDRTSASWAFLNRLRVADVPLDAAHANTAAEIRGDRGVSIADAHLGAMIRAAVDPITVLTSDPKDIRAVAGAANVTVVAI